MFHWEKLAKLRGSTAEVALLAQHGLLSPGKSLFPRKAHQAPEQCCLCNTAYRAQGNPFPQLSQASACQPPEKGDAVFSRPPAGDKGCFCL